LATITAHHTPVACQIRKIRPDPFEAAGHRAPERDSTPLEGTVIGIRLIAPIEAGLREDPVRAQSNAVVVDLELTGAAFQLPGDDLVLVVYTAAASSDQEMLDILTAGPGNHVLGVD
jgi:hypothetical protein